MKLSSPYLKRKARLELTSLMDVMFLVLVFFVYSIFSMAVHKGVKVDLPAAHGTLEKGERLVVTITVENRLELNGRSLDQAAIVRDIARLRAAGKDIPVLISGDRRAALGTGIGILSALREAGVEKVSFQVNGGEGR